MHFASKAVIDTSQLTAVANKIVACDVATNAYDIAIGDFLAGGVVEHYTTNVGHIIADGCYIETISLCGNTINWRACGI